MTEEVKQYIEYEQLAHKIIEGAKKYEKILIGKDKNYISKKELLDFLELQWSDYINRDLIIEKFNL